MHDEAAGRIGPGAQVPAVQSHALAHADQPVPAAARRSAAAAVVGHLDLERRRPVGDAHRRRRAAGVLEGVGERLLDDAVHRQLERARQRPRLALDRQVDRQLALRRLRDQLRQLREVGLRRQRVVLALAAQEAEQPVQLDDGLPAGRLDRAERLLRLVGPPRHHPPRRARLDAHHADVVGHDVVQLARDPDALLEHRPARVLLALALQLGRLLGQFAAPVAQRADGQRRAAAAGR